MPRPLKVLIVSPEAVPFVKTGDLADVAGALPKGLRELGCDVRVFLPYYQTVKNSGISVVPIGSKITIPVAEEQKTFSILKAVGNDSFPTYFLHQDEYYNRETLYGPSAGNSPDNAVRFILFCRATLQYLRAIKFCPDVIHCNNWQTGLVPVYLKTLYADDWFFKRIAILFTIHNLAYQGDFDRSTMGFTGLDQNYFSSDWLELYGSLNFLKAGIMHADLISTVSQSYSQEIQTPEFGCGLDDILRDRQEDLYGIVNGIDYDIFDPATDKQIAVNYDRESLEKKRENKKALQQAYQLPVIDVPIIGIVSLLADQKGFDLVAEIIEALLYLQVQFILLGTGEEKYHTLFREIAREYPQKAGINISYNPKLAHQIYAGADMLLMPSRYEPCGLGQLISLRYGTIPIVHSTGGLADTIVDLFDNPPQANGFVFEHYSGTALLAAINTALLIYKYQQEWKQLMKRAMLADFSWRRSAEEYIKLYKNTVKKHRLNLSA